MTKKVSLLALVLLVPVPSIGVLVGMVIAPNIFGRVVFFASKAWILLLPLLWHLFVDKRKLSLSKPKNGGFAVAALLGIIISFIILAAYFTLGRYLIEPQAIKDMAVSVGLNNPRTYLAGAAYWILVNSVLEEYVWRWFVVQKCKSLMPANAAIVVSALCFTIHHIVAMQIYFNGLLVLIASAGIFIGAAAWSWCYNRYRSIWPGYISHAIVDLAVFAIGYLLIFK
ncbi:MAG: CPBP family intramembrane glutamic endopeptidase [Planctomycetota bacterium]|jgi:membrane protease YdiL (CAAX protease family)